MSIIRQGFESADLDIPVVLPTLNLDFANSQSLDSRITFSRGSIGTCVNRNGLIETIAANQPRFDFDPISGECRGLLIEESRTNLIVGSNSFGASTADYGITASATTSPDGTTNASKLFEKATNNYKIYITSFTAVAGTTYCGSVFVKAGERKTMFFKVTQSGDVVNNQFDFNMNTGAFPASGATRGAIYYGNGWWRVYATITPTVTVAQLQLFLRNDTSGALTYQGDGSSGFYVYGMQVEAGSFPTSYIPTTASTVTRSADNASMTGTNFSSWYNSREGTIQTNIAIPYRAVGGARSFALDNGTVAYMLDFTNTSTVVGLEGLENSGYRSIAFISNSTSIKLNQTTAYSTQPAPSQIICVNGTLNPTGKTYLTTSNYANLRLGTQVNGAGYLNGTIRKLAYYPKALSPAELQYLTQ